MVNLERSFLYVTEAHPPVRALVELFAAYDAPCNGDRPRPDEPSGEFGHLIASPLRQVTRMADGVVVLDPEAEDRARPLDVTGQSATAEDMRPPKPRSHSGTRALQLETALVPAQHVTRRCHSQGWVRHEGDTAAQPGRVSMAPFFPGDKDAAPEVHRHAAEGRARLRVVGHTGRGGSRTAYPSGTAGHA
ncbi:hypothetical protein GCM10010412_095710 [Nonomuraea recticatena]|uniref:Uncharacterized protein n=1 Tax=Nonomuraea recticatena TaxID=46178 RepID=A0ABP6FSN3_9ACTN